MKLIRNWLSPIFDASLAFLYPAFLRSVSFPTGESIGFMKKKMQIS